MARYGTWKLARGHLENDIEMADVPETIQKSRRKKEVHFAIFRPQKNGI